MRRSKRRRLCKERRKEQHRAQRQWEAQWGAKIPEIDLDIVVTEIRQPHRKLNVKLDTTIHCGQVGTMEGTKTLFECPATYNSWGPPPDDWTTKMTGFPGYLFSLCPNHKDYEYAPPVGKVS